MSIAPPTRDEPLRLDALRRIDLVDTPLEARFERLTALTQHVLGVDIVAISLVDEHRQFFKSIQGLNACGTPREHSFCAHAIHRDQPMVVPD